MLRSKHRFVSLVSRGYVFTPMQQSASNCCDKFLNLALPLTAPRYEKAGKILWNLPISAQKGSILCYNVLYRRCKGKRFPLGNKIE